MAARGLDQFLSEAAARGFAWGRHDCMLFAADWALAVTGRDPAAPWRGAYADEAGATAIVDAAGGWIAMVQDALEANGWERCLSCRGLSAGDIVLCVPPGHLHPVAGVATAGKRVALVTRNGLVVWPLPAMFSWSPNG